MLPTFTFKAIRALQIQDLKNDAIDEHIPSPEASKLRCHRLRVEFLFLFTALSAVLKVVISDICAEALPILTDLGCDFSSILEIIVTFATGIAASLFPLLAPVIAIITSLSLSDLLSLLRLSL
ncbi:hypothetical protein DFJ58DRAFT_733859 [Suillus subalutaceus]|uniref:uncharacterized protein n=1 Tax=Suillus subalutaceus TaxID=48586 RepID=UPI001B85DABF|nr:uncharacterized protein DFJ58DRAFT_733859 [Suillus subalutaceus]KAG1838366.1 hypothetical protein DFJ58DRAFT_733859 [Suillus subalutaceus]